MTHPLMARLLLFAKELQKATGFDELLVATQRECEAATGYKHCWFMVKDHENSDELRLLEYSGEQRALIWDVAPTLKVTGDLMMEEIMRSEHPVVVADARTDPRTNKQIVAQLGNRTIINIPMVILDKPFGVFGLGTFGDVEGCRLPSHDELGYLVGMAGQISVAVARLRITEERSRAEAEKRELERRLAQIQKLESLGLLAGGIAHDFNNLLTVILAGCYLARSFEENSPAAEELVQVIAAAERGRDLTRQLLAMSRTQALAVRPLDLNTRLAELLELLRRVFPETISIDFMQGSRLPEVAGDASQLDQVFMNLCVNARDAMPNGGRLTVETEHVKINGIYARTHPWAKPGRYILASVTDTGIGMEPAVLDRVFEPFFTTKLERSGTGLGLAVSYGIVRQHGGMLHCYSEPGVGTTFKVYLPVHTRDATEVGTKIEGNVPGGTERILVAEDDPAVRVVAERILQHAGYQVTLVGNGEAACKIAATATFDLAILDVVMPGITCQEAVRLLRAQQPQMGILLASGYTAETNVASLLKGTQFELLRKPYDPDQLLRAVRRALDL